MYSTQNSGFTLIELLIVIAIAGILATVSVSSYTQTRQSAELALQTDTIISQLRESKSKSQNATEASCLGFYFKTNQEVQSVKIPYQNPFTPCLTNDKNLIQTTTLNDNQLQISQINSTTSINPEQEITEFTILYYPPKGDFQIFQASPENLNEQNQIQPSKIQIQTEFKDKANSNYITILSSGIIQKENIANQRIQTVSNEQQ